MHEVLVNCLGDLSLPRESVVRLTDRPDMTLDVYRGRKTTIQQQSSSCTSVQTSYKEKNLCLGGLRTVDVHMNSHVTFLSKTFPTDLTSKRLFTRV